MGISVADNFSYLGGKPLDGRIQYATLAAMKAMTDATLYEGCEAYCVATDKYYKWKSSNTVDADTGKWREVSSGGQTYNDFTGATASTAGAHGLVPAPSAGDEGKVLFGNGAWGALPSVDLSGLSPEAFIFSETEKPVGMWTDGKLLYAKTFPFTNNAGNYNLDVSACAIDICFLGCIRIVNSADNNVSLGSYYSNNNDFLRAYLLANHNTVIINAGINYSVGSGTITLFYTKTTDSPLASDEKYAGLLANGTVVYKKTVASGGSAPSGTTLIYRLALLNSTDVVYFTR